MIMAVVMIMKNKTITIMYNNNSDNNESSYYK